MYACERERMNMCVRESGRETVCACVCVCVIERECVCVIEREEESACERERET